MLTLEHDRRAAYAPRQLAERDHRSGKRDRADEGSDEKLELVPEGDRKIESHRLRIVDRGDRDQNGGETDQRVHRRDQLGHLRHLHSPRDDRPEHAAYRHATQDRQDVLAVRVDQRQRDQQRDRHADHAVDVAAPCGVRARQPLEREDEAHCGDQIPQCELVRAHPYSFAAPVPRSFFLNMSSIRCVTRKPPNTLIDTSVTADDAEPAAPVEIRRARREHRADHDDARDRVGQRHQRRVQRRRHVPDDVVADEDRQHEDDQVDDDRINACGHGFSPAQHSREREARSRFSVRPARWRTPASP